MKLYRFTIPVLGLIFWVTPNIGHAQQADTIPYLSSEDIAALQSTLPYDALFAYSETGAPGPNGTQKDAERTPDRAKPINIFVDNFVIIPDNSTRMPVPESAPAVPSAGWSEEPQEKHPFSGF